MFPSRDRSSSSVPSYSPKSLAAASVIRISRPVLAVALFSAVPLITAAIAQGIPHLSANPGTYRQLLHSNPTITSAMCQPADTYCAAHAVGQPLFGSIDGAASDSLGNLYLTDLSTHLLVKLSPSGQPTIIAGEYNQPGGTVPVATGAAVNTPLFSPKAVAVDLGGNVYIADANELNTSYGSVLKVDPFGTATRLTALPAFASPAADGANVDTQAVDPTALATDILGNLYFADAKTCTVRELPYRSSTLKVVAGSLSLGCNTGTTPSLGTGALANTYQFANIADVAAGQDGTIYLTDHKYSRLYSVTTDGVLHLLAGSGSGLTAQGPAATSGDIAYPNQGLAVDAAGDVFLTVAVTTDSNLVEVTKGTATMPSQVVIVSGVSVSGQTDATNFDGEPANLVVVGGNAQLAFSPAGWLILPSPAGDNVAYLDRNGSSVYDTNTGVTQQTITFTNTGSGLLTGINFGGTSYPYALSPTPAELAANGATGNPPFSIDQSSGTCLAKFNANDFTLAPAESCTLVLDYAANPTAPAAGSFTLYSNDPLGPTTVSLSAEAVTRTLYNYQYSNQLPGTYTVLTPSASSNATGSFTVSATVLSSVPGSPNETTSTPGGSLSIGATNNTTGIQTIHAVTLASNGTASTSFTGLTHGSYSLQAVFNDISSNSVPSYSPVQTLYASATPVDFTAATSIDYLYHYARATAQFLNLHAQAYTNPGPVEFQDFAAGTTAVGYTLKDAAGTVISATSSAILPVGKYTVTPTLSNAAALNLSLTAHPETIAIGPADLTLRSGSITVPYGQYLSLTGTPDATHFSLNNALTLETSQQIVAADQADGNISYYDNIDNAPADPSTTLLPAGRYILTPTLTGSGAANYSLTALPGILQVQPADLTLAAASYRHTGSFAVTAAMLCSACYTAPNTSLLTSDPGLQVSFNIYNAANMLVATLQRGSSASTTLTTGSYRVVPTYSGSSAANYSPTIRNGTIVVQ